MNVVSRKLNGVPVLEITSKGRVDSGKLLVYTHGGAYTLFSAHGTLPSAALVANRTGLRVISVDYTNPPRARWKEITEQTVKVFEVLNAQGFAMKDLAIYCDSASGGLAAGTVLKLHDDGLGMPAAVVLWSPWADITETGNTYVTLKDAEPTYLYERILGPSADAYADPQDQKQPYFPHSTAILIRRAITNRADISREECWARLKELPLKVLAIPGVCKQEIRKLTGSST